ncbi:MAG: SH3 domain-containing protein [Clostridiaceae bacterium]|nr:SH3 domain-containing protein [Clostridiaceae bacterium]
MNEENYWVEKLKEPKAVIMTNEQIDELNGKITEKVPVVYDLSKYTNNLSKGELIKFINLYKLPTKTMYSEVGVTLDNSFYNKVKTNCNLESIKEDKAVSFGIIVRKTNLRTFPTGEGVYDSSSLREIDRFQESSAEPCTPVIILHTSSDGKWFFVQMYNYRAWVKVEDVAVGKDKETVIEYSKSENFLIVTGNHITSQFNPQDKNMSQIEFAMGTKIPMLENMPETIANQSTYGNYAVKLPYRNDKGQLEIRNALISKKEDVNIGFLTYTRENILKEAFKLLGDRYDWGNKYNGRDCSGFVISIYSTFGFMLPRNTNEQEKSAGIIYNFTSGDSLEKRNGVLDKVKPGAVIFMNGHEMLYLGKDSGVHYMIHDFTGYGVKGTSGYSFHPVYEVAVTSTLLPLSSGTPFIKGFTSVLQLEQ